MARARAPAPREGAGIRGCGARHVAIILLDRDKNNVELRYWRLLWKTSELYSCISLLAEPRGAIEGESSMRRSKSL